MAEAEEFLNYYNRFVKHKYKETKSRELKNRHIAAQTNFY